MLKLHEDGAAEDLYAKLDDTRFNLIVTGQSMPSVETPDFDGLLRTHVVTGDPANDKELARAHIPAMAFYLVRPDGHIGLAGTRLDISAVTRYLAQWRIGSGGVMPIAEPLQAA